MELFQNNPLRRALDGVTEHLLPHEHACVIEGLRSIYPHAITPLDEPPDQPHGYNCYMYALGMHRLPDDLVDLALNADISPDGASVAHLIASGSLEPDDEGELVIYFGPPMPKHAGLRQGRTVTSKWGIGRLWSHGLDEVPLSYGFRVQFFKRLPNGAAESLYRAYVERLLGSQGATGGSPIHD
jgi:hypothetical protein